MCMLIFFHCHDGDVFAFFQTFWCVLFFSLTIYWPYLNRYHIDLESEIQTYLSNFMQPCYWKWSNFGDSTHYLEAGSSCYWKWWMLPQWKWQCLVLHCDFIHESMVKSLFGSLMIKCADVCIRYCKHKQSIFHVPNPLIRSHLQLIQHRSFHWIIIALILGKVCLIEIKRNCID